MAPGSFKGVYAALRLSWSAPGKLDRVALGGHLAWLRSKGVSGVLVLGSTAEFPLLDRTERREAMEAVAELAGPLTVLANISDISLETVKELGKTARQLGLPAVSLMPPSFYPCRPEDQLEFFLRAAEAVELPVFLYNFPDLTGNRIEPETIRAFAARAPLAGFKQSGAEFAYHEELVRLSRELGFALFSGADTRLPEVFRMGAAGCIGGLVNFVPELMVGQYDVFATGKPGDLEPAASRMQRVGELINRMTFPANVGAGMRARGFEPGIDRVAVSAVSREKLHSVTEELRRCFAEWGLEPYLKTNDTKKD